MFDRRREKQKVKAAARQLAALPAEITPQWLSEYSSFAYLAANRPNSISEEKDLVIAHEKFQLHDPGDDPDDDADDSEILVGFADGSVAAVATKEAAALIEKSRTRLAAIKPLKRHAREPAD